MKLPEKKTYIVSWILRNGERRTRHTYSGLTMDEALMQLHTCACNSANAVAEGFEVELDLYIEED